jgi:hypothetical protein
MPSAERPPLLLHPNEPVKRSARNLKPKRRGHPAQVRTKVKKKMGLVQSRLIEQLTSRLNEDLGGENWFGLGSIRSNHPPKLQQGAHLPSPIGRHSFRKLRKRVGLYKLNRKVLLGLLQMEMGTGTAIRMGNHLPPQHLRSYQR